MPKIVSVKNLTISEVKKILEEEEAKRDLSTLENLTLDYSRKLDKVGDAEKARSIVERLMEKFNLPEEYAVQLVNIMPRVPGEVRLILSPLNRVFSSEELEEIIGILHGESEK